VKKFSFALVVFSLFFKICQGNGKNLLDSANLAYAQKKYSYAITLYEGTMKKGLIAPELYFNLGNAYYKSKNIPKAILNYERAKKIEPDDEDININLKIANSQITDRIESPKEEIINIWKRRFFGLSTERGWSFYSIGFFIICIGLILLYLVSPQILIRQISFILACTFLLLSISTSLIAWNRCSSDALHTEAIILAPNITAKGSPDEKGTDLFILHEGAKVTLLQTNGSWKEVRLANGAAGWLPESALEAI
jgi:tetratricopeptide (TPR) repeat protein